MTCSIIIPTRLRANSLFETLNSLQHQTEPDFDVVVVCDGEDPSTRVLASNYRPTFPLTWIFTPENRGLPAARNTGARAAKGELLLFLDDDMSVVPDWVFQHRRHHETSGIGRFLVVCGRIVHVYLRGPLSHTEQFLRESREHMEYESEFTLQPGVAIAETASQYACFGVNRSIPRTTFLDYGGFDEVLRFFDEEMEMGSRLYEAGVHFRLEPRAVAYHRDEKDLVGYLTRCWSDGGKVNVYRALRKGQRSEQTRRLATVRSRNPLTRLAVRMCWHWPNAVQATAEAFRRVTDAGGSRLSYAIWCRVAQSAGHWRGVRSEGLTLKSIRSQVGSPLPVLAISSACESHDQERKAQGISPRRVLQLIRLLRRLRYEPVGLAEGLSEGLEGHKIVLTFDDVGQEFYSGIFPHLDSLDLKPLVFLPVHGDGRSITRSCSTGPRLCSSLSVAQIREMYRHGVQFGSSALTCRLLSHLSISDLRRELAESKTYLEDLLGSRVTCFAHPAGAVDARVRADVAAAGYEFALSTRQGLNFWPDRLALSQIAVFDSTTFTGLLSMLLTGRPVVDHVLLPIRGLRTGLRLAKKFIEPNGIRRGSCPGAAN